MEAPPLREGAFSPEAAYYIDKLARKEDECNEITAQFNKYKVKTKVRFDQLRHEISNILHEKNVDPEDEQQHPAMLLISLNETQFKLEEAEKLSISLRSDMERQQVHINDQIILIKNLEDQLRVWEESEMARERRRNEPVDLERVQQQMMYKDERIVELNSVILDKERQILDLQDACRSASEVATSKKEAMRIVQKKFDEMEKRTRREASTETDDRVTGVSFDTATPAAVTTERAQRSMQQPSQQPQLQRAVRTSSPGRAVHVVNKNGLHSPPPLDPSELDDLPGTSKLAKTNVDGDSILREKKQRKRVTFALPQAASREDISRLTADADTDEITEALVNLTAENDRLRGEVERVTRMEEEMDEMAVRVAQAESAVSEAEREARHASLKARAVAQARIKELEDRMATQNALGAQQMDRLVVETETLRSTRDWEVEQNARMREQLAHTKEKLRQLREELDASAQANRVAEKKLDEKESLVTSLVAELEDAESLAVFLEDQKHQILDDVDQLKDIIKLHEEQINLLEADNLIYETRVGHLREELGVSKVNQRDHIKSKAFHTKLQMVNKEKEQIDRKANDERLRTKALHAKVQILEAENERLMARLCEAEMAGEDTSSLDAACKQLQGRMEEAEAESARVRAEFEARIKGAEFAADSLREECDKVRAARHEAEQQNTVLQQQHVYLQHELQQTQLQLQHLQQQQPGPSSMQQVQHQQQLQRATDSDAALRLAASAQETLTRERDELAERVHVLGGENFELTRRTDDAEKEVLRLENELSRVLSRLRESSESAAAADAERAKREERRVEREEELMDLRGRVTEREATVERMETELKRIRSELDHAHLSMAETAAVKKEVQHLQQQLEIEREAAAAKWQQVMVQLKSYEELASNSGWDSRKTSIDETATAAAAAELRAARAEAEAAAVREQLHKLQQAQQMQPAHHLQPVQQLQQEVPRRAVSTEDEEEAVDRHELDLLRARVEELESEVELSHELNFESGKTVQTLQKRLEKAEHEKRLLESLTVEFSEDMADMKEDATAAAAAPSDALQQPVDEEEKEEMRRKIEEMEEEAELSAELHVEMGKTVKVLEERIREMEMERRLHEMMSVELTNELHELRQMQQGQLQQQQPAADDEDEDDAAEKEAQLQLQLEEEKRQRAREQQAAREELHRLQLALHAAEDAKREVARQLAEREQTESLVRATAATFDVVAAAAGAAGSSSTESQQPHSVLDAAVTAGEEAENEEERATLVQENVLLREAVYQNVRHSESVTSDVARLLELKEELEKAVEALRGEIWSLNGQLKASVFDRENLQDRVIELDTRVALEKRRADLLDVELAEQVELRENAQRQAAEAENESNRRLAECAEMDGKREDLEKAYALLAGYYSQLQEAYNVLYTQQQQQHANLQHERMLQAAASSEGAPREDRSTQTDAAAAAASPSISAASVAVGIIPSSSRRAMAEAYASRLAALRELSVQLTKSVLATELATLESELDNSITSIEGLSNDCPEAGANVDSLLDAIIQDYDGSSSVSPDARMKIASVHAMLRAKISEVERVHSALREQRGVCTALEQRLTELEAAGPPPPGLGSLGSPGGVSSTAPSELEERIEECEALRAHVEQLQEIISRYVAREEAARLATREADVDSLFRANAELAHENVRLQNEMDEEKGEERKEEQLVRPETTSSSTQTHEEKDFDEAELELIKEELEAERAERRKAEQRIVEVEEQRIEQQEQLEETIVDLTMQLQQTQNATTDDEGRADRERQQSEAAAAAAETAAMKEELERVKKALAEKEKELAKEEEEVENMKIEIGLKAADRDEMKRMLQEEKKKRKEAVNEKRKMELEKDELQRKIIQLQEAMKEKEVKEEKEEGEGWGVEDWSADKEEGAATPEEVAELRSKVEEGQKAIVEYEDRLKNVEKEKDELMKILQENEKKIEEKAVKSPEDASRWGGWNEDKTEEEASSTSSHDVEQQLRSQLQQEQEERAEVEEERLQLLQRLQEAEKLVKELQVHQKEKDTKDGWAEEEWGGEEKTEEEEQSTSQVVAQLRSQLKQMEEERNAVEEEMKKREKERMTMEKKMKEMEVERNSARERVEEGDEVRESLAQQLQSLESENARLRLESSQLMERREEVQQVQHEVKIEDESGWSDDGWAPDQNEVPMDDAKLLELERKAREKAEEELRKMKEDNKRLSEDNEDLTRSNNGARKRIQEVEDREEKALRQVHEMREEREGKASVSWTDTAWGESTLSSVDPAVEVTQLRNRLHEMELAVISDREKHEREKKEAEDLKEAEQESLLEQLQRREDENEGLREANDTLQMNVFQLTGALNSAHNQGRMEEEEGAEVSTEEEKLRREIRRLKSELEERTEELEGQAQRAKDAIVFLERDNLERDETIRWLKDKIEAMEKGREIPPPPAILFVPTSEVTMVPKVAKTVEDDDDEEEIEEEVKYDIHSWSAQSEYDDETTELSKEIQQYLKNADSLQAASRTGGTRALYNERIRLRHIVHEMSIKLQELEDTMFNNGVGVGSNSLQLQLELEEKTKELETTKENARIEMEALRVKFNDERRRRMNVDKLERAVKKNAEKEKEQKSDDSEQNKLQEQNNLLKDSEAKLYDNLEERNGQLAEAIAEKERQQQEHAETIAAVKEASAAEMAELQRRVEGLEQSLNAKISALEAADRDHSDAIAKMEQLKRDNEKLEKEKGELQSKLDRLEKLHKPATGSTAGRGRPSYTGGSRTTSNASSIRTEENDEEPVEQSSTPRVDQAQMQVLLETYRLSLGDLLERVSEYLLEADNRDRSTAVTIDCLQLSIDHVNQQLEMGKKRGTRNKRTTSEADPAATTRTEETTTSENVVTTRESMTESMEDEYMTATIHSAVSSSEIELAEERRHSLIGRSSPAHSPASSAHNESSLEIREEARLEAGGAEEETQSEGEDDEDVKVGETIHKELDATRADLSSLRELVKDMGGWVQQVQQMQSEKEGEREEMDHLRTEQQSQLEMSLERAQVDKEVMETELEQANQAIWQLQQAAKAAAATATQLEQRVAAAEEAATAARQQLDLQLEEEEAGRERHERERSRLREQADELARMLSAADAAAAAATTEVAAARETTRAAKRERDRIENELSSMLEEAEGKIEQLEEDLRRERKESEGANVQLARMGMELNTMRVETARQSESLQQSAAAREETDEKDRRIEQLIQQVQQLQQESKERDNEREERIGPLMQQLRQMQQLQQETEERETESRKEVEEANKQYAQLQAKFALDTEKSNNILEDLQVALKEVSADADIAKAQAHALESELEQEQQQRAADREAAAAAAAALQQTMQQLQQRVQQGDCIEDMQVALKEVSADADAAKALASALESELEQEQQQRTADIEAASAAAAALQQTMQQLQQQLQEAELVKKELEIIMAHVGADADAAKAQALALESELEQEQLQRAADREAAAAADASMQQTVQQLQQQLQQSETDKAAAEEEHARAVGEMDRKLQQGMADVKATAAAATLLQQSMHIVEQQLQQALLDQAAAAGAAETIRVQAGRIEELEEQLQHCQDVEVMNALLEKRVAELEEEAEVLRQGLKSPPMDEQARKDLEEDIARMEMELAMAQERIESAQESMAEANERAATSDGVALAARQEVAILRSELEKLSFEQSQLLQGSDEDGPGGERETNERVRELERQAVETHNEMGQMLEDLRSAEDRAAVATARAAAAAERVLAMENTVAELRTQLAESLGETESLRRSINEVHHLEYALQQARTELSQLAGDAAVAREQRRAMEEERDAALVQLADARDQLTQRTEQAIRASANRNESMNRMIELEQQINAAAAAAATAAQAAHLTGGPSVSRRVSFDVGSREESPAVAITMPEEESNLTEGEEESSPMDELLPRSTLVFASTPSPNVLDQLRSWLRRQARQSRALRGNRALMPYVRYAGALYVVFLQLAFIHCWFF